MASLTQAVAYYRMSTDKQETSIDIQRAAVRQYAEKNGINIRREYIDEGISGDATVRRLDFQRMIEDAKRKADFTKILCWDMDRFGRFDPLEAGYWVQPLRMAGVILETVAQGVIDWETFQGRLMFTVQQEGKHQFLADLSRKCMTGQLEGARRGDWLGGAPPYGYDSVDRPGRPPTARKWPRMLAPGDRQKIEVVRWLFKTYAERDVSLRWLADELHRRCVLSPRGTPLWAPTTIRGILKRREYVGDLDWGQVFCGGYHGLENGQIVRKGRKVLNSKGRRPKSIRMKPDDFIIVKGCHEPLIDRAVWEVVQAKLTDRQKHTNPETGGGTWLLTGLLVCGHCGSSMVGTTNTVRTNNPGTRVLICCGYHTYGLRRCHRHQVREKQMVDLLIRKLQQDFLNPDNLERLREEIRRQVEEASERDPVLVRDLKAQIADLANKIATGNRNMALAPPDMMAGIAAAVREWRDESDRLTAELERLQQGTDKTDLEEQVDAAERMLWRLREAVNGAEPSEVRAVLRELVVKVELFWECRPKQIRQHCRLSRGIIYVRADDGMSSYDTHVSRARASLWL
jgi:site-specific DNA recombinase